MYVQYVCMYVCMDVQYDHLDDFKKSKAIELLLIEGDILFIPALWIHYIISITPSIQCNARFMHENTHSTTYEDLLGSKKEVIKCLSRIERMEKSSNRNQPIDTSANEFHLDVNI